MNARLAIALSLACGVTACQGVFNVDFDKAHVDAGALDDASSNGSSRTDGSSPAIKDGSLAGKWDITGSRPGAKADTGTLELGPNAIRVAISSVVFDFSASKDRTVLTYSGYGEPSALQVDQSAAPISWGAIPITQGGVLHFTDPVNHGGDCTLKLGAANSSFECLDRVDGWPRVLPHPLEFAHYEMTRLDAQPSSFGDLGGHWEAKMEGRPQTCTVDFVGNKISGTCPRDVKGLGGNFDATFAESLVSGHLSSGIEFAGNRR